MCIIDYCLKTFKLFHSVIILIKIICLQFTWGACESLKYFQLNFFLPSTMMTSMTPFRYVLRAAFRLAGEHFPDVFHVQVFHLVRGLGGRGKSIRLLKTSQKCLHWFRGVHVRRRFRGLMSLFSSRMSFLCRRGRWLQSKVRAEYWMISRDDCVTSRNID